MIPCGPRHTQRHDDAYERGYDPHPDDVAPATIPLNAEWQAYLDASLAQVKTLRKIAGSAS
ncbi:hypothetical protein [Nocardioides sp. InS609-2]|uniref:hypothetical protein n=1 Tax=Nocardioides sp. InS609-2 TaxID=2760705 RepID=UPI0020C107F0|nr:hypothetical protein [Nocardioides sp. InS609-2]